MGKNQGSATLEASIIIPLFLFFMLALGQIGMLLMAQAHIYQSLAEAAAHVAGEIYNLDNCDVVLQLLPLQFRKYLGDDFFVDRTVAGGGSGIVIHVTRDQENPKIFYAKADYGVRLSVPVLSTKVLLLHEEIKQKCFLGYSKEEKSEDYVYITPNQEVYHLKRSCSHLSLQISRKSSVGVKVYEPCRFCGKKENDKGAIYIGKEKKTFHYRRDCSGLKRTVIRVKKSEVHGRPACLRCGR